MRHPGRWGGGPVGAQGCWSPAHRGEWGVVAADGSIVCPQSTRHHGAAGQGLSPSVREIPQAGEILSVISKRKKVLMPMSLPEQQQSCIAGAEPSQQSQAAAQPCRSQLHPFRTLLQSAPAQLVGKGAGKNQGQPSPCLGPSQREGFRRGKVGDFLGRAGGGPSWVTGVGGSTLRVRCKWGVSAGSCRLAAGGPGFGEGSRQQGVWPGSSPPPR